MRKSFYIGFGEFADRSCEICIGASNIINNGLRVTFISDRSLVRSSCYRKIMVRNLLIYIYLHCVRRLPWSATTLATLIFVSPQLNGNLGASGIWCSKLHQSMKIRAHREGMYWAAMSSIYIQQENYILWPKRPHTENNKMTNSLLYS